MKTRAISVGFGVALGLAASSVSAADFTYDPPGELVSGSGEGRADEKVWAPNIRFPIQDGPAYANSQVWGVGGSSGPSGDQCDAKNYSYPWHDNYCETRTWDMPLCPAGTGHQGQDIRPGTCEKDVHPGVAVVDGTITNVGSYSVYLTAADGTRFDYLHMSNVKVVTGQKVKRGDVLGLVSNQFNGTPTTTHLHFNITQNVSGVGTVYVPPYTSLIAAYQALIGPVNGAPKGKLEAAACEGIRGWAQDPDAAEAAISVRLSFDPPPGKPEANEADIIASLKRDDLCGSLGSCAHGFYTPIPASLIDGLPHEVHVYAQDSAGGAAVELDGSPVLFTCALPLPEGVRRHVIDEASLSAWSFDDFFDIALVDDGLIELLPVGEDLPDAPSLAKSDDGSSNIFLLDGPEKRVVGSEEIAAAWSFEEASATTKTKVELDAIPLGSPLRPRPFVLKGSTGDLWLVDDPRGKPRSSGEPSDGPKNSADAQATSGCGCRVAPLTSQGAWATVALAALAWRRRRKVRRTG